MQKEALEMKLDNRFNWVEDDLAQPQPDRLLIINRDVYVTDWLALVVSFIAGSFSLALVVIIFGGQR